MSPSELDCYTVYMHINKINNMKYIGCTSRSPEKRYGKNGIGYSSGQEKFYSAIKEYGWDNFEHKIIETNLSKADALKLEEELIKQYNTVETGYNAAYGGERNLLSEQSKQKLREQRYGEKNPNYNPNKNHTYKLSRNKEIRKERKRLFYTFTEGETSCDGRKSIEFSKRQTELKTGTGNPNYGKHTWCYGIKMTEKQKQKMYEAWTPKRKELARQQKLGNKNPQAKKVICLDTGIVYDTIVEASRQTNISERTISRICNGGDKKPRVKFAFVKEGDI